MSAVDSEAENSCMISPDSSCESKTNSENLSESTNKRKARKISDIHLQSASRLPEAEANGNEKRLTLESLVEAVAILVLPSVGCLKVKRDITKIFYVGFFT